MGILTAEQTTRHAAPLRTFRLALLFGFLALLALMPAAKNNNAYTTERSRYPNEVLGTATITEITDEFGYGSTCTFSFKFQSDPNGPMHTVTGEQRDIEDPTCSTTPGQVVPIWYDPANPRHNFIPYDTPVDPTPGHLFTTLTILLGTISGLLLLLAARTRTGRVPAHAARNNELARAGWYSDTDKKRTVRWWNGQEWTDRVRRTTPNGKPIDYWGLAATTLIVAMLLITRWDNPIMDQIFNVLFASTVVALILATLNMGTRPLGPVFAYRPTAHANNTISLTLPSAPDPTTKPRAAFGLPTVIALVMAGGIVLVGLLGMLIFAILMSGWTF